jgi:hypothetical protein
VDEVVRDVWAMGAVITGKCMAYLWVPSEEGELHLVMDANVSKPIHAFYLLFLFLFLSRD